MKKILSYLCPTFIQITLVSLVAFLLRKNGYVCGYDSIIGMVHIVVAGVSSALWGCVFQIKYNDRNVKIIFRDFFRFKADWKAYILVILFLILDFSDVLAGGSINFANVGIMFLLFLKSIAFGGIEEMGWRYTFQPIMEQRLPYIAATVLTFIFWGMWHFLFFFIDGSICDVRVFPFLAGLLINCFILSAVWHYGNNLWLCVMAHALINTFSQAAVGGNVYVGIFAKVIIIILAVFTFEYL